MVASNGKGFALVLGVSTEFNRIGDTLENYVSNKSGPDTSWVQTSGTEAHKFPKDPCRDDSKTTLVLVLYHVIFTFQELNGRVDVLQI